MLLLLPLGELCRLLRGNENFKPNHPFSPMLSWVSQLLLKSKGCAWMRCWSVSRSFFAACRSACSSQCLGTEVLLPSVQHWISSVKQSLNDAPSSDLGKHASAHNWTALVTLLLPVLKLSVYLVLRIPLALKRHLGPNRNLPTAQSGIYSG